MKKKVKKWYTIFTPPEFGEKEIGITLSSDPKLLIGRRITVGAAELTGDMSRYFLKLTFKVVDVKQAKAYTRFDGLECFSDYIARMVMKRTTKIESIQDLETRDGAKIRVKSVAILPRRVKTSIEASVRNHFKGLIEKEVKRSTLESFVKKAIAGEIKTKIMRQTSQVYPLKDFEIRKIEILF